MLARISALSLLLFAAALLQAENWPGFRGPFANGKSSESNIPSKWSKSDNILWKVKLPGPGSSSPIVWGNRIFLTQSLDKGGKERALLCLDRKTGKTLWQKSVSYDGKEPTHATNPYCSATPVTDGKKVIASFGSAGLFCFDFNGEELWKKDFGPQIHIWGNASSPVLYQDKVFFNVGPGKESFLVALDQSSGKELWRANEPGGSPALEKGQEWIGSWSTPLIHTYQGKTQLIMSWPNQVKSYNPENGALIWNCNGLTKLVYTSPLAHEDTVVAMSGFHGSALAVKNDGSNDVTSTHRLWHQTIKAPQRIGSGFIHEGFLYMANAGPGTIQCIELKTGKDRWENQRLGSSHWGSLVYAEGKIFATDQTGDTHILAASPEFKLLGKNSLGEHHDASLAISQGNIFIRTFQHLWCVGANNPS